MEWTEKEIAEIAEKQIEEHEYNESIIAPNTSKEWMRKDIDNNAIMIEFLKKQLKVVIERNNELTKQVEELSKKCYDLSIDIKDKEIRIENANKRIDKQESKIKNLEETVEMYGFRIS